VADWPADHLLTASFTGGRIHGLRRDFTALFATLTSQDTDKGRIKRWIETMVKAGLFEQGDSALSYDKDLWLEEAFTNYEKEQFNKRKAVGALLADDFATSNWYLYIPQNRDE